MKKMLNTPTLTFTKLEKAFKYYIKIPDAFNISLNIKVKRSLNLVKIKVGVFNIFPGVFNISLLKVGFCKIHDANC